MRISSIKLNGFKSFRSETTVTFPKSVTAIVGPNGSGKSNIADAFRWVLGEQSLKQIRSRESTDVIFAGSANQSKLSRAQVTVMFEMEESDTRTEDIKTDDVKTHSLESGITGDLAEVEIIRKVYADGESEYLLNNSPVRLYDIQLLLAEHNVGQKNYAVIGQGMIDEVLKMSPQNRLDFFYEATGVKKYQIKLHKAELKLGMSSERLMQSQALIKEITPHKKYLEKMVEKYTRKSEVIEQLDKKHMQYYWSQYWNVENALAEKRKDFAQIEKQHKARVFEVEELDKQVHLWQKTEQKQEERRQIAEKIQKLEYAKKHAQTKITALEYERSAKLEQEGDFDSAFLNRRAQEVDSLSQLARSEERSCGEHLEASRGALARKQLELQKMRDKLRTIKQSHAFSPDTVIYRLEELLSVIEMDELKNQLKLLVEEIKRASGINAMKELEQLIGEVDAEADELRIKCEVLKEKITIVKDSAERYKGEADDIFFKLKKYREGSKGLWFAEIERRASGHQSELLQTDTELEALFKRRAEIDSQEEQERQAFYGWQKHYQQAGEQRQHMEGLLQAIKIELARLEIKREQIIGEMREELGDLKAEIIFEQKSDSRTEKIVDLRGLRGEIKRLKNEAAELGEIEEEVVDEFIQVKARYDFLSEQTADLEGAIASLKKIVVRLKRTITTQFNDRFTELSRAFNHYFKILFNGGNADISRIEFEEGEYGIDIIAHPPGKKIRHIAALSGGERSLLAVALMCAIITSNPPPFVILDEIDAALDEANSNHLADILKKLAKNTQLIVITHNRATMEIADVLHGVTMGGDGTSRLISVKLEDYVHV